MTNHVHLLVSPKAPEGLGKMMQTLGRYYVQYFNHHYKRTGTLWEGRYKASLISSDQYLFSCMRYIELNPVRAGMVDHPAEYPWSSYHCNALGVGGGLIVPRQEYAGMGSTAEARQKNYQSLFQHPLDKELLKNIRDATNKSWVLAASMGSGWIDSANKSRVLGGAQFKASVAEQLARMVTPIATGGGRKSRGYHEMTNIN